MTIIRGKWTLGMDLPYCYSGEIDGSLFSCYNIFLKEWLKKKRDRELQPLFDRNRITGPPFHLKNKTTTKEKKNGARLLWFCLLGVT